MIAQPRRPRCLSCGHPGTRQVPIDGRPTWLCDVCLSPEEIRTACDAIRSTWPRWRLRQARREERHGNLAADEPRHVARLAPTDQDR
jgi:hypothetical protein